jgi:hypothetical protein
MDEKMAMSLRASHHPSIVGKLLADDRRTTAKKLSSMV